MLMVAHVFWALVLLFVDSKCSGCGWKLRTMLMVAHVS